MSYQGETIDAHATLLRLNQMARREGFSCEPLVEQAGFIVPVFRRLAEVPRAKRVYLSGGLHGDEPGGSLAILELLEEGACSRNVDWTLFPMLNPAGISRNQRENHQGIDLNRDYLGKQSLEVQAHTRYVEAQEPWDLAIMAHEDWESAGFYLYDVPTELTEGWARKIVDRVGERCPIDLSEAIDEMPAQDGIIRPKFEDLNIDPKLKGEWPEAIYLHMSGKIRGTYTFEAPSAYDLPTRTLALRIAILTSVEQLLASQ